MKTLPSSASEFSHRKKSTLVACWAWKGDLCRTFVLHYVEQELALFDAQHQVISFIVWLFWWEKAMAIIENLPKMRQLR
jgi:hypothetical protein